MPRKGIDTRNLANLTQSGQNIHNIALYATVHAAENGVGEARGRWRRASGSQAIGAFSVAL